MRARRLPRSRPISQTIPGYKPLDGDSALARTPISFRLVVPEEKEGRKWTRSGFGWREKHPSGETRRFLLMGEAEVAGDRGVVYGEQRERDPVVFMLERGSKRPWLRYRRDGVRWRDLGKMKEITWPGANPPTR